MTNKLAYNLLVILLYIFIVCDRKRNPLHSCAVFFVLDFNYFLHHNFTNIIGKLYRVLNRQSFD